MKNTILTILSLAIVATIAIFAPDTKWYVHAGLVLFAVILNIQPLIAYIVKTFKISYNKTDGLKVEETPQPDDILN